MRVSLQAVMERYKKGSCLSSFCGISEQQGDAEILGILLNTVAAAVVAVEAYDSRESGDAYYIPRAEAMSALRQALKDVTP